MTAPRSTTPGSAPGATPLGGSNPLWPDTGWHLLQRTPEGWHQPTPAWWRRWLGRPELATPPEACRHERRLVERLQTDPLRPVPEAELQRMADADARDNWRWWLGFRDQVQGDGTLETWYLRLMRKGQVQTPPPVIDEVVQDIVRGLLEDMGLGPGGAAPGSAGDAFTARAAEMLCRSQRITLHEGAVLAGDAEQLDLVQATGGYGDLGRLLREAQIRPRRMDLRVLTADGAADFWASACAHPMRRDWLLDMRLALNQDLGHGIQFTLQNKHSGLSALAQVLERWVWHLLRVDVRIEPVARIDDPRWRWHTGLDTVSSSVLNDLYEGHEVSPERQRQLIGLFRLTFVQPQEMRQDLQRPEGVPVYLGLAHQPDGLLKLKPQNLILNLPLARD